MEILIQGMTHLGFVFATALAEKGANITLIQVQEEYKGKFTGKIPFFEPGIDESFPGLYNSGKIQCPDLENIDFSIFDIILVAMDTPTNERGISDYSDILKSIAILSECNPSLPMVLLSQVFPGFTRSIMIPNTLFYMVETLVFGDALFRIMHPEQIIFGAPEEYVKFTSLPSTIQNFLELFSGPLHLSNYETAELAKISFNLFLSLSVFGSNLLANISEEANASWTHIKEMMRKDTRIGQRAYLSPGLGVLGGNLPRDLNTLKMLCDKYSLEDSSFVSSLLSYNFYLKSWVSKQLQKVKSQLEGTFPNNKIGLLGFSYKVNTSSVLNSPALELVDEFSQIEFIGFDPSTASNFSRKNLVVANTPNEVINLSNILILTTPWPSIIETLQYSDRDFSQYIIIDPWAALEPKVLGKFRLAIQRGENYVRKP